jgi:hypothetical protein
LSKKAVIAAVVCTVLLVLLCLSGLVMSMSDGRDGKPDVPAAPTPTPTTPLSQRAAAELETHTARPDTHTPRSDAVTMPDVVGLNAAVAQDQLNELGLTNLRFASGDKRYRVVLVVRNWSVTKQSTPAGTQVDKATLIVLTCVKP